MQNFPQKSPPNPLLGWIEKQSGWLSFEQFMSLALYDPEVGYYSSKIRDIGRNGDFSTSAQLGSLLGKAIARWARNHKKNLQSGFHWHLIEIGGGNGELAATILKHLGWQGRIGLTYHLVEISRPLRERQKLKLKDWRVCWHDSATEALEAADGKALIFSNELVDAYPCRQLHLHEGQWSEIGLTQSNGAIQKSQRPLSVDEVNNLHSSVVKWPSPSPPQTVEIHASYRGDFLKTAEKLRCGSILTIDYGDEFPTLYHRQPKGTLRGYFHHLRFEGPELYTRIGQQDLTADVNFTDLKEWGTEAGLVNTSYETQKDFVTRWLGQVTPRNTDEARLLDPIGAGSAFKVLQQNRGIS